MIDDVYFLTVEEVIAIHADQIARYGGDPGLRDRGLLESAVHAARNVAAYGESLDLCDLAAAYVFHLAENQSFIDGNKRAALASALVFLHQNDVSERSPYVNADTESAARFIVFDGVIQDPTPRS